MTEKDELSESLVVLRVFMSDINSNLKRIAEALENIDRNKRR